MTRSSTHTTPKSKGESEQAPAESVSCYSLEFSYPPGAARLAEVFTYNKLVHIHSCLRQQFLAPDLDPYLLPLMVRGTVALWVIQRGVLQAALDLHPFLCLHVDGRSIPLGDPIIEGASHTLLSSPSPRLHLTVDWGAIEVWAPALEEPLAQSGTWIRVARQPRVRWKSASYISGAQGSAAKLRYGFSDLENGQEFPLCDFVDPDPSGTARKDLRTETKPRRGAKSRRSDR